jgi:hypothetical protein
MLGVVACALAIVWAAWPHGAPDLAAPRIIIDPIKRPVDAPTAWPESAFAAVIWKPSDKPRPDVSEPNRQRSPVHAQLVGIVNGADGRRIAAIYDPGADALRFAAAGETAGPFRVEEVTNRTVVLGSDDGTRTLRLDTGREDR